MIKEKQETQEMVPYSHTLSYNQDDPKEVRETMQKLLESIVRMTILCGIPFRMSVDYQSYKDIKKSMVKTLKEITQGEETKIAKPKGMKAKHNALIRWSAYFSKEKLDQVKDLAKQDMGSFTQTKKRRLKRVV